MHDHKCQLSDLSLPRTLGFFSFDLLCEWGDPLTRVFQGILGCASVKMATPLRFLRPYTYRSLATANSSRRSAYLSFYELAVKGRNAGCLRKQSTYSRDPSATDEYTAKEHSAFVANRIARLKEVDSLQYPRVVHKKKRVAVEDFCEAYNAKSQEELSTLEDCVTVTGTPE